MSQKKSINTACSRRMGPSNTPKMASRYVRFADESCTGRDVNHSTILFYLSPACGYMKVSDFSVANFEHGIVLCRSVYL